MVKFVFSVSRNNGSVKILTKGDNNSVDDRGLYAPGQLWLEKKDIVGRARGYVQSRFGTGLRKYYRLVSFYVSFEIFFLLLFTRFLITKEINY